MNVSPTPVADSATPVGGPVRVSSRVASVDAVRGLVVFTMIFVNDLAGVPDTIVPAWMKHYRGSSGMTFVDLVFPAFLFIVGMSLPLALSSRREKGQPVWNLAAHVLLRTLSLLLIGVLMVNGTPDSARMGWSGALWSTLMYASAILAFCTMRTADNVNQEHSTERARLYRLASAGLRVLGFALLGCLALIYEGHDGHRIISFSPFSIHHQWYGILGLIGWAYLEGAIMFLVFGANRIALLACMVLLMCLYPADRAGAFSGWWLARHVGIGGTLGSQAAITVAGLILATVLNSPGSTIWSRARFTLLFVAGLSFGALLLNGLYGINKNQATPSWCLWACAITASLWLVLHCLENTHGGRKAIRALAIAGQNVFLAYLLSGLFPSALELAKLSDWYSALATPHLGNAIARSAGCAILTLCVTAGLNALGFRLKL